MHSTARSMWASLRHRSDGGDEMGLKSTLEQANRGKRDMGGRRVMVAARLLSHSLGIHAEPAFDPTDSKDTNLQNQKTEPYDGCLFKDVLEFGIRGEAQKIRLQVVDEKGLIEAESKGLFSPGDAIDLLKKLPLPLSPGASQWLKDCLREGCQTQSKTSQTSGNKEGKKC
jgi:hypothetical protein